MPPSLVLVAHAVLQRPRAVVVSSSFALINQRLCPASLSASAAVVATFAVVVRRREVRMDRLWWSSDDVKWAGR